MKNFNSNYGEHKRSHDNLSRAISFPLPVQEGSLFKHGATPHVLNFLSVDILLGVNAEES